MKSAIDDLIPEAYRVLKEVGIAEDGVINKSWRGQISTFGSVVQNGSLLAAVAFFSSQGGSNLDRQKLMTAIWLLLRKESISIKNDKNAPEALCKYIESYKENRRELKMSIINRAVALKLAMNLYELKR